jgi:hypothetical protein
MSRKAENRFSMEGYLKVSDNMWSQMQYVIIDWLLKWKELFGVWTIQKRFPIPWQKSSNSKRVFWNVGLANAPTYSSSSHPCHVTLPFTSK